MKKFFYLLFSAIFICFSTFSLVGCKKNTLNKVSKNLTAYSIDVTLDDEKKEITGTEKINYKNETGKRLEFLCLHLYPRAFREGAVVKPYTTLTEATCFPNGVSFGNIEILSVMIGEKLAEYSYCGEDEDVLKIDFGFSLENKKSVEIKIDFKITIPNSTHRFGWFNENINLGNWYPVVCMHTSDGFDLSPYYSTGDPFFSDIANYEVSFKFPKKYKICSTGEIESSQKGEITTAKISAKAVRDFAITLSSNSKIVSDDVDDTKVFYMGYNSDTEFNKYLKISKEAVKYFEEKFGDYPYSTLSVVKTPFIYGGMEYPNIVFISDAVDDEKEYLKVIVHEIAHQWWYGIVGNNETKEAWLDESLSEFSTVLFFGAHEKYGMSYDELVHNALSSYLLYVDVIQTIRGEVNTKMNLAINEYQNDYEYSYMIYVKGVLMFDSLKNMVGEKKVFAGLKRYYADNKFKIATSSSFFEAFKKACHQDLDNFFDGYLDGTAIISKLN